jgi:hypothetical protein
MDPMLESLTDQQKTQLIQRLYERDEGMRQALLEEAGHVLTDIDPDEIAEDAFFVLDLIDVETLWDKSGPGRKGYVSPDDQALNMIEEELEPFVSQVWQYLQLDMPTEAKTYMQGILLGLYRFDRESNSEFRSWASDIPRELFDLLKDKWRKKVNKSELVQEMNDFCRQRCP